MVECELECGKMVLANLLEQHVKLSCPNRPAKCTWGCGSTCLTASTLGTHEKGLSEPPCPARIVECPLGCEKGEIQFQHLKAHVSSYCVKRVVPCSFSCGLSFPWKKLDDHTRLCPERTVECPLGCGATMPLSLVETHETSCDHRFVPCTNGCGITDLKFKDALLHRGELCMYRRQTCKYGCGVLMRPNAIAFHENEECPNRPEKCAWRTGHVSHGKVRSAASLGGCGLQMSVGEVVLESKDVAVHRSEDCTNRDVAAHLSGIQCPLRYKNLAFKNY